MHRMTRSLRLLARACVALLLAAQAAYAATVNVVGLFPGKAIVSINGGAPRTLSVGQKTSEGVTLVSSAGDSAVLEIDGKRSTLRLGEAYAAQGGGTDSGQADSVTLSADSTGHYRTLGMVNGRATQFLLDTGAFTVWLSSDLANRLGVPYRQGDRITAQTAGGPKPAWMVKLESVRIGGLTLRDVDAAVAEGAGTGDIALLGQSFLSRVNMYRDGNRLVLSRKDGGGGTLDARDKRARLTLQDSGRGMFATNVTVNGNSFPFIIDTGATLVSIDAGMAQQMGLNYRSGTPSISATAAGQVRSWRVRFDSVTLGPITIYGVEGSVREGGEMGVGLLGMSFLSRVEMHREGENLTLVKRF